MSSTRTISELEWDLHKSEIKALYLTGGMILKDVMTRMKEVYSFHARCIGSSHL